MKITFETTEQANEWLNKHNNITINDFCSDIKNKVGLFANRASYNNIVITYEETSAQSSKYQFCEIEKTNLFKRGNGKYIEKIIQENPKKQIVKYHLHSSSRTTNDPLGVVVGFSASLVENENYLILYKTNADDNEGLIISKNINWAKKVLLAYSIVALIAIILIILIHSSNKSKMHDFTNDTDAGVSHTIKNEITSTYKTDEFNLKKYEQAINDFVPDNMNTKILKIGEKDTPNAAIWLSNGNGSAYTTNSSVVTVTSTGIVEAVGKGEAYIIIQGIGDMYQIYKYIVK